MYSEIVQHPQFYLDSEGLFSPEATSFLMTGSHLEYLIKYLNSNLVTWMFKHYYAGGGLGEGFRYKKKFIKNLPIPDKKIIGINDSEIEIEVSKAYNLDKGDLAYIIDLM